MFHRHSGLFVSVGQEIRLCHFRSGSSALAIALVSSGFGAASGCCQRCVIPDRKTPELCTIAQQSDEVGAHIAYSHRAHDSCWFLHHIGEPGTVSMKGWGSRCLKKARENLIR